jgi:hypothetical protein
MTVKLADPAEIGFFVTGVDDMQIGSRHPCRGTCCIGELVVFLSARNTALLQFLQIRKLVFFTTRAIADVVSHFVAKRAKVLRIRRAVSTSVTLLKAILACLNSTWFDRIFVAGTGIVYVLW